jgi:hypothetical protein
MTGHIMGKASPNKILSGDQSGRVTFFGIVILVMLLISIYELSVISKDWNRINLIPLKIILNDDVRTAIPGVGITISGDYFGQTDMKGELTALMRKPGKVRIIAKKEPFSDLDTTVALDGDGLDIAFSMYRPHADLTIIALNEVKEPLQNVDVVLDEKSYGKTGDDGKLDIPGTLFMLDSVFVKLNKEGFSGVSQSIYLADASQTESFTLTAKAASTPSKPPPQPPPSKPAPQPDFQSHYELANRYLDRAISGESKYFGRALSEIDQAIRARPKYNAAKQLKVEILFNFAKSLQNAGLLLEAANRCNEALKIYREIPEDALMGEVQKLKAEIDKKLK